MKITIVIEDNNKFSYPSPVQSLDPCSCCPNSPLNGGSGYCNCTLPYLRKTTYQKAPHNVVYGSEYSALGKTIGSTQ
jgi:hypothetical protein